MASTITLTNTIAWCSSFTKFLPLAVSGNANEPAITTANVVKQTILGAPFAWRWNRATQSFSTAGGTQDYSQSVSTFGFLERGSVTLAGVTNPVAYLRNNLPVASVQGRPRFLAAQSDDNAGNITFRFTPVPDSTYTAALTFQKKATLFTALSDTWAPIPDEYSFVYNHGFLAMSLVFADDPRWSVELPRFLASLVGISEGLSDTQKSTFLESWLIPNLQARRVAMASQQGAGANQTQTIGER